VLFRFSEVTKSYGGTEILRGVSFQINPGEKVGLVGRNGAGKTTLFRLLTGHESPDTGDIVTAKGIRFGLLEQHVDFEAGETVHTAALSAFKHIHDIEAEMRRLEKQMETDHSASVLEKYADLQTAFEQADGFTYAARAEAVLLGVGFTPETWSLDTATLSGGQKNRLGMARLLLSNADVLLLDEPTNHLDVDAVEWLEEHLRTYDRAYVTISHDRYFLDRTTERIIEIENGRAVSYKGNYSEFLVERELRREQQQRKYENQQAFINKTQEFIRRNLEGQKTKQAKSRRNMLERMERLDAVQSEKSGGNFRLKKVERAGNNVLTTEDLAIGYGDQILASNIRINLHRGGVLGVIGGNGTGKTTLLRTLLGEIPEINGRVQWGTKTNIGYYSQSLSDLYDGNDLIAEMRRVAPTVENVELRSFLARFLFFGDDIEKRVRDLSGGEKGRLALAKLIYSQKNVLVLDEPTNHLDIPAREALESALDEYPGTIVTVSHDRFFLDRIATQMLSFERDGRVLEYPGNYTEFHDWRARKEEETWSRGDEERVAAELATSGTHASRVQTAQYSSDAGLGDAVTLHLSKNERQKVKSRINEIERLIPDLESDSAELTAQMSTPQIAADFTRLSELSERHQKLEARIQALYNEWQAAADKLAAAG
jgi:ATP-binding cassette subfamily F protein 3